MPRSDGTRWIHTQLPEEIHTRLHIECLLNNETLGVVVSRAITEFFDRKAEKPKPQTKKKP